MTADAHIYHVIQSPPEEQPNLPVRDKGWVVVWEAERRVTSRWFYTSLDQARASAEDLKPRKVVVHAPDVELNDFWKEEAV